MRYPQCLVANILRLISQDGMQVHAQASAEAELPELFKLASCVCWQYPHCSRTHKLKAHHGPMAGCTGAAAHNLLFRCRRGQGASVGLLCPGQPHGMSPLGQTAHFSTASMKL